MSQKCTGFETSALMPRRQLLQRSGMGLGGLALADLLGSENAAQAAQGTHKARAAEGRSEKAAGQ